MVVRTHRRRSTAEAVWQRCIRHGRWRRIDRATHGCLNRLASPKLPLARVAFGSVATKAAKLAQSGHQPSFDFQFSVSPSERSGKRRRQAEIPIRNLLAVVEVTRQILNPSTVTPPIGDSYPMRSRRLTRRRRAHRVSPLADATGDLTASSAGVGNPTDLQKAAKRGSSLYWSR